MLLDGKSRKINKHQLAAILWKSHYRIHLFPTLYAIWSALKSIIKFYGIIVFLRMTIDTNCVYKIMQILFDIGAFI